MRWGLGPVFLYECLAHSRRWQTYALRSAGVAVLLAGIASIAVSRHPTFDRMRAWRDYAALGESYFYAIIGVELTLVMLAAPAATAGALCVDRARGTLAHMLATELSDAEIVLGKLAARLLPVLGLVAGSWPVLAISSLLGGIDPVALALAFAVILAVALLGCAMALALSVWARKPHEVVMVVYTAWMLALLLWPIWFALSRGGYIVPPPAWSLLADPYYLAFAPYSVPGRLGLWDYLSFFAATLGASAALAALAVWRMRPVARRGTDERRKEPGLGPLGRLARRLPGPSLDGHPVLWREWHRSRPSRWMMILIVLVGGATGIACIVGAVLAWRYGLDTPTPGARQAVGVLGFVLQLIFGLLMLSAAAPMAMSEERQRGSLDLLAATALSTRTIVLGKWLGTLRLVPLLALAPGLVTVALATAQKAPTALPAPGAAMSVYNEPLLRGEVLFGAVLLVATILVHGALIASVGLVLAVWIARQSRAIALSVGFAVMVGAAWPIFIAVLRMGPEGQGVICLSPIAATFNLADLLSSRYRYWRNLLWWTAFWDLECLVLALGLLWLAVRSFDGCFGRIPERPRRASILSDVVVVVAGLLGVGGVFGAAVTWITGSWNLILQGGFTVMACILLLTVGLILLTALAASLPSRGGAAGAVARGPAAPVFDRRAFSRRWWEAARLLLLLAIGPALIALAVATVPLPFRVLTKVTSGPGGTMVRIQTGPFGQTHVFTEDAMRIRELREATPAEIAAAEPAPQTGVRLRLLTRAALAVVTILADGAAFISLGLALGVWIGRRGRAIAAGVGLVLFLSVAWPILYLLAGSCLDLHWGPALASVIAAVGALLVNLPVTDETFPRIAEIPGWVGYCDALLVLSAVILSGLAIRTLDRRRREPPGDAGFPDSDVGRSAGAEPALAGHGYGLEAARRSVSLSS